MQQFYTNALYKMGIVLFLLCSTTLVSAQSISGTVFFDGDNDGVKDATEVGFPYVSVMAYDGAGLAGSATSANDGSYTISGLLAGQAYRVEFVFTAPYAGYNDGAVGGGLTTPNLRCSLWYRGPQMPTTAFMYPTSAFRAARPSRVSWLGACLSGETRRAWFL